jgi:hypothetical protein
MGTNTVDYAALADRIAEQDIDDIVPLLFAYIHDQDDPASWCHNPLPGKSWSEHVHRHFPDDPEMADVFVEAGAKPLADTARAMLATHDALERFILRNNLRCNCGAAGAECIQLVPATLAWGVRCAECGMWMPVNTMTMGENVTE